VMRIFLARDVLDAAACRHVQAAMDAGTPEEAEVLDEGFEVQGDVRRATQIEVADTVLAMVEATLDRACAAIASFYGLALQSREGASVLRYETGGFYKPHVDRVLFLESACEAEPTGGFRGGILRLFPDEGEPIDVIPTRGTLVAFPAGMRHEVTRVIAGRRDTIVDWFY
jgi:predicted 2-oxoglutarate/Fe(II)-dependent dioxygenase YbiX